MSIPTEDLQVIREQAKRARYLASKVNKPTVVWFDLNTTLDGVDCKIATAESVNTVGIKYYNPDLIIDVINSNA